jgi:hypothetical protein
VCHFRWTNFRDNQRSGTNSLCCSTKKSSAIRYPCYNPKHYDIRSRPTAWTPRTQLALILPPRTDGKLWVGTVTWTSSKPVELVVLHGYTNVTADSAHGVPLIAKPPTGAVAITLIGPSQFMPSSDPVPSGTAPFAGSAVAFHTLSGAKFTVTYTVDAIANTPTKTK